MTVLWVDTDMVTRQYGRFQVGTGQDLMVVHEYQTQAWALVSTKYFLSNPHIVVVVTRNQISLLEFQLMTRGMCRCTGHRRASNALGIELLPNVNVETQPLFLVQQVCTLWLSLLAVFHNCCHSSSCQLAVGKPSCTKILCSTCGLRSLWPQMHRTVYPFKVGVFNRDE